MRGTKDMKVAIGIPGSEEARWSAFYQALWRVRGVTRDNVIATTDGDNVAANRNKIGLSAMAAGYDAVWYVDNDQICSTDTLKRLLSHDKDIVSGLYLRRRPPLTPVCFDQEDEVGYVSPRLLNPGDRGLVEVKAVGAGCLLVKRAVFEAVKWPWWRLGQIHPQEFSEDLYFCREARKAGFSIWCDLDCLVGHQAVVTVWPQRDSYGEWKTVIGQGTAVVATVPAVRREE
jgi:hypothetical protein